MADLSKIESDQSSKISTGSTSVVRGNLKFKRFNQNKPPTSFDLTLEKILGLTSKNANSFAFNPSSGDLVYPSGAIANVYNIKLNKTIKFITSPSRKPITALAFSPDGKYLAFSCKLPEISIWELYSDSKTPAHVLRGHRFGIEKILFSPNMKYLVTIGDQNDKGLFVWDWVAEQRLTMNKISKRITTATFTATGQYLITAGETHLKLWNFDASGDVVFGKARDPRQDPPSASSRDTSVSASDVSVITNQSTSSVNIIEGKSAFLGKMSDKMFTGITTANGLVYAVTHDAILCVVNINTKNLEKWMDLKVTNAYSITTSSEWLICSCGDGIIRFFKLETLEHLFSLPKPPSLGSYNVEKGVTKLAAGPSERYADTIAISFDEKNCKLASLYSDRTLFVWDLKNLSKIVVHRSALNHCSSIMDVQLLSASSSYEVSFFVTGSVDKTLRIWSLADNDNKENERVIRRNVYCKNLSRIIYLSDNHEHFKNPEMLESSQLALQGEQVRCLRASSNGALLACGDQSGVLRVYSMDKFELKKEIKANEQEITSLDFTPKNIESLNFIATGGRDRLINIYDVDKDYEIVNTFDDHSSSIIALRFFYVRSSNKLGIVSCSADRSIIIRIYNTNSGQFELSHREVDKSHKIHSMDLSADNTQLILGQDKRISIWEIETGKIKSSFETKEEEGSKSSALENMRVCVDVSGCYIASCHRDGSLRIRDYNTGSVVAKVSCGDFVTGICFAQNNKNLVVTTAEGCILIWKLPEEIVSLMNKKKSQLGIIVKKLQEFMDEPTEMENSLFKDFKFDSLIVEKELKEYISKQKELGVIGQTETSMLSEEVSKEEPKPRKDSQDEDQAHRALIRGRESVENASRGMSISNFINPTKVPDWAKTKVIEDKQEKQLGEPLFERPGAGGKWKGRLNHHESSQKSLEIENLSGIAGSNKTEQEQGKEKETPVVEELKAEEEVKFNSNNNLDGDKYDNMRVRDDLDFDLDDDFEDITHQTIDKPLEADAAKKSEPLPVVSLEKKEDVQPSASQPVSTKPTFEQQPQPQSQSQPQPQLQSQPQSQPQPQSQSQIQIQPARQDVPDHVRVLDRSRSPKGIVRPIIKPVAQNNQGRSVIAQLMGQKEVAVKTKEQEIDLGDGVMIQVETVDDDAMAEFLPRGRTQAKSDITRAKTPTSPASKDTSNTVANTAKAQKEEPDHKRKVWEKHPVEPKRHEVQENPAKANPVPEEEIEESMVELENIGDMPDIVEDNQGVEMNIGDPFTDDPFLHDKYSHHNQERAHEEERKQGNVLKYKVKQNDQEGILDLDDIKSQISQVNKNIEDLDRKVVDNSSRNMSVFDMSVSSQAPHFDIQQASQFQSPDRGQFTDFKPNTPDVQGQKPLSGRQQTPGSASVISIDRKQLVPTTLDEIYKKRVDTANSSFNTGTQSPTRKQPGLENNSRMTVQSSDPQFLTFQPNSEEKDRKGHDRNESIEEVFEGLQKPSQRSKTLTSEVKQNFDQIAKALQNLSHLLEGAKKEQLQGERSNLVETIGKGLSDTKDTLSLLSMKGSKVLNASFDDSQETNLQNMVMSTSRDMIEMYSELLLKKIEDKLAMSFVVPADPESSR